MMMMTIMMMMIAGMISLGLTIATMNTPKSLQIMETELNVADQQTNGEVDGPPDGRTKFDTFNFCINSMRELLPQILGVD